MKKQNEYVLKNANKKRMKAKPITVAWLKHALNSPVLSYEN